MVLHRSMKLDDAPLVSSKGNTSIGALILPLIETTNAFPSLENEI